MGIMDWIVNTKVVLYWDAHWQRLLESPFTTTLIGAFAGALAGAWGAQRITDRSKYREQLLNEVRATNAAIALLYNITNSLLGLKKQHVKRMKEDFDFYKNAVSQHKIDIEGGAIPANTGFNFPTDFQYLNPPQPPTDILQTHIFEKLSLTSRGLCLATVLNETLSSLKASIEKRNKLIDLFQNDPFYKKNQVPLYFGFPINDAHIDTTYADTLEGIATQLDAAIFFSILLNKDLYEYGNKILVLFKKKFKKDGLRITELTFSTPDVIALIPKEDDYQSWITNFVTKEEPPKPESIIKKIKELLN